MTALVFSPFSYGRAIELGNRIWRKRLLPVGDVSYQGRMLHFTKSYLDDLAAAFHSRAYDQVPFQLADAKNAHTNDPERTRGEIIDMDSLDDGLWVTAKLSPAGEQILSENPMLGVSARIVEAYDRSDGRFFPAAVQHVLGTLDPRIPALGPWHAVEASNWGQSVVDLSNCNWAGEPSPVELADDDDDGDDELTDAELDDLIDAMAEADAEESAAAYSGLEQFNETFTANWAAEQARDQARQAADLDDLISPARTDEDIVARAIARASAGIYDTSRVSSFASPSGEAIELATELTMATGEGLCGDPDDFGRCSSRYHDLMCVHAVSTDWQASEPPRSTYATALSNFAYSHETGPSPAAYGDGEDAYPIPQGTLELAHQLNQSWGLLGDTFDGPNRPQRDAYELAAGDYPDGLAPELPGGYASIRALAKGMGLR
jgi:hypothetical protein